MAQSMEAQPLVSLIVNNYNYDRFLAQAIDSALQQQYSPVEVIVVDDGSTDHSRDIINQYSGQIVPVFQENRGQASAVNSGFEVSSGEIVVFLDADDLVLPTLAEDMVNIFISQPEVIRVQYRMAVIDENGVRTGAEKPEKYIPVPAGDVHQQALKFPFDMAWLPTSGNAFRASELCRIMPVPETAYGKVGSDWYLVHLSCLLGPVYFLDKLEACYRAHQSNNFEVTGTSLNLDHIRQTIKFSQVTANYLTQYSRQFNLSYQPDEIYSVSYIANRMVSVCLDPKNHPIPSDTRFHLVKLGAHAAFLRFDILLGLKLMFVFWFLIMSVSPRPVAALLGRLFLFPESRKNVNHFLSLLHEQPKSI